MSGDLPEPEQVPDLPSTDVPNVVGLDAADACEMVRDAGLVPCGPHQEAAPSSGVILQQTPVAATVATVGATVELQTQPGNLAAD